MLILCVSHLRFQRVNNAYSILKRTWECVIVHKKEKITSFLFYSFYRCIETKVSLLRDDCWFDVSGSAYLHIMLSVTTTQGWIRLVVNRFDWFDGAEATHMNQILIFSYLSIIWINHKIKSKYEFESHWISM